MAWLLYISSKRFCLERKEYSDVKVVSLTKKEYGFAMDFLKSS